MSDSYVFIGDTLALQCVLMHIELFQAFHFPPAFHSHVTQELRKPLVLILNKIDLAPPELVAAWKHYFRSKYPDLDIVCFTSFPRDYVTSEDPSKGKSVELVNFL